MMDAIEKSLLYYLTDSLIRVPNKAIQLLNIAIKTKRESVSDKYIQTLDRLELACRQGNIVEESLKVREELK